MGDGKFQDLQKRWLEYKVGHKMTIDTSVYDIFNAFVVPTIIKYCEENESVNYQYTITEEGASVTIKSKRLLFDDGDSEILRLVQLATLIEIQSTDDVVTMELWFRSWTWSEK